MSEVTIIGYGIVGKAYHKMFPEAYVYDEPLKMGTKKEANKRDLAIVCVPTNMKKDGSCDVSIVEQVVSWLETDLILIKSAVVPGTTDKLRKKYGKKVNVSVEAVGESKYFVAPWKHPHTTDPTQHDFLIVGGEEASRCADYLWEKVSPDVDIHLMTAVEAECAKYMENSWGATKITFANEFYNICQTFGADYKKVLQGVGATWLQKMHMRVVPGKQGYVSKCLDKDVPGIIQASKKAGYTPKLLEEVVASNKRFRKQNE